MIVFLEEPEAWSLMMLVSAVAIDNADISEEGKEAIRRWRSDRNEESAELEELTDAINAAINAHLDTKFTRRVKNRGRFETVRK
ncbi:MAG: hypothetical protein M0R74_00795 [Dehalococcoidia bacterium]|nr:hypothetical protein [Dehalococcoidia bacterium]